MRGRTRKLNVVRSSSGRTLGERPEDILAVAKAYRTREVGEKDALNALAGYTLGVLHLRHQACDSDPSGITREQLDAGNEWARLCRRHAAIMGYSLGSPKSPSFVMVGSGQSVAPEPNEDVIAKVRSQWRDCFHALQDVTQTHGWRVMQVTAGVCLENWPVAWLGEADFGHLRVGLNTVGKALK